MIPVLLGAAAIWGISNLEKAERKARDAREIDAEAAKIAEDAQAKVEASHEKMKWVLTELGKRKMYLMKGNVTDVANFMHNLNKKFRLYHDTEGLRELEKNGITEETLKEVTTLSQNTLELAAYFLPNVVQDDTLLNPRHASGDLSSDKFLFVKLRKEQAC